MKLTITTEIHGKMKATFNIFLFSLVFLLLSNCTPKESHINKYEKIPFLHEIKGTKNYEIIQIGDTLGGKVSWDKINRYFILNTFHSDATLNQYYKYSLQGDIIDSVSAENAFFEDDIFTFNNFYNTWVKDGDKTNQKFIKIISHEDPKLKDSTKYLSLQSKEIPKYSMPYLLINLLDTIKSQNMLLLKKYLINIIIIQSMYYIQVLNIIFLTITNGMYYIRDILIKT